VPGLSHLGIQYYLIDSYDSEVSSHYLIDYPTGVPIVKDVSRFLLFFTAQGSSRVSLFEVGSLLPCSSRLKSPIR
jgi:hypothetical protein